MTPTHRVLSSVVLAAALVASPAFAGNFAIDKSHLSGVLVQAEGCPYDDARTTLTRNQMTVVADVPRTQNAYRFIVAWKQELFGATVYATNCKIDLMHGVEQQHPWCEYLPGLRIQCPMLASQ
jgi:hypothetical protein